MALQWNGERSKLFWKRATAEGVLRAAIHYQSTLTQALSKSYPPASRRGEYPRARTFNLRSAVLYQPTSVKRIAKEGRVKIGFSQRAFYGIILELKHGRIGLLRHLRKVRSKLATLVRGGR